MSNQIDNFRNHNVNHNSQHKPSVKFVIGGSTYSIQNEHSRLISTTSSQMNTSASFESGIPLPTNNSTDIPTDTNTDTIVETILTQLIDQVCCPHDTQHTSCPTPFEFNDNFDFPIFRQFNSTHLIQSLQLDH